VREETEEKRKEELEEGKQQHGGARSFARLEMSILLI